MTLETQLIDDIINQNYDAAKEQFYHLFAHHIMVKTQYLEIWTTVLNHYLKQLSFKVPDDVEIFEKDRLSFLGKPDFLKTYFLDYLFENEWRHQCEQKFGGKKPTHFGWRDWYKVCENKLTLEIKNGRDLHWAIESGFLQWVRYFCDDHSHILIQDLPLQYPILRHDTDMMKLLFSRGVVGQQYINDHWSLLHYAVFSGSNDMVQLICDFGSILDSQDKQGLTPLIWSAKLGYFDITQTLLDRGSRYDILGFKGESVVQWLFHEREFEVLSKIIQDRNFEKIVLPLPFLNYAALFGLNSIIKNVLSLKSKTINLHNRDQFNRSALHWACHSGNLESVQLCIDAGLDSEEKDVFNLSSSQIASYCGYQHIIMYLMTLK